MILSQRIIGGFTLLAICFVLPTALLAQTGGNSTYAFLKLPNAARSAALGGDVISIADNDLNFAYHNPALLTPDMNNSFVMNYVNYIADINIGYLSYARQFDKAGTFAAGLHYINYGIFTRADIIGNKLGEFTAAEYALNLMWAKPLDDHLSLGVTLKPVYSQLDRYKSFGLAFDLGLLYRASNGRTSGGLVAKNIGYQIKAYHEGNHEPLPFDLQLGISHRLAHAPFRFTLLFHHLDEWDLTYTNPNNDDQIDPFTGEVEEKRGVDAFFNKAIRHVSVGVEVLPTENFHIDLGMNFLRREEMKIDSRPYLTGLSIGFGFKLNRFHISYGRAAYHLAAASNHFSISTSIDAFFKHGN